MSPLTGKRVLITGGASGIGAALVKLTTDAGAEVTVLDYNEQAGAKIADSHGAQFRLLDVTDAQQWQELAGSLNDIDYVALNAGVMTALPSEPLKLADPLTVSPERYKQVMAVNVDGAFFGVRSLTPIMNWPDACITVTSSMAGLVPLNFDPIYSMTKHAIVGMVRSVAASWQEITDGAMTGARINAICPGGVDTPLVPNELKAAQMPSMEPGIIAGEILDLWEQGGNGEIRLKLLADLPATIVSPPELG
ncbi:MAG: SDR family oxidoreductase [Gammaproteobacteria bacterium]|jgi:NAD(P)-dependent dehydrogenase (short-subunit alcohol dehydrogenase family)|nr:SDR family oxidoreductase [Gammaproteobacteria bacterium]MBT4494122.1 SDR family oxidoreductase [Gammaproteobacteria bacterium]MBT7371074.1 SDR family oxidoreductase [Gammaproteobacteria bacterium]